MSECAIDEMLESRFWFVGITGTVLAIFGVISNALLAVLFLSRRSYRNSPFFFLGFVAFYDTLLDFTYIVLLVSMYFFFVMLGNRYMTNRYEIVRLHEMLHYDKYWLRTIKNYLHCYSKSSHFFLIFP